MQASRCTMHAQAVLLATSAPQLLIIMCRLQQHGYKHVHSTICRSNVYAVPARYGGHACADRSRKMHPLYAARHCLRHKLLKHICSVADAAHMKCYADVASCSAALQHSRDQQRVQLQHCRYCAPQHHVNLQQHSSRKPCRDKLQRHRSST
jgi:hypothetical protein